jgi:hypothetical protein
MQCFPHIIHKFGIDGRREGNGQYMKLLENHQASRLCTEEDVHMLWGCRSQPMFDKLKDMILTSWRLDGEQHLADRHFVNHTWTIHCSRSGGTTFPEYLVVYLKIIHTRGITLTQRGASCSLLESSRLEGI